MKRRNAGQWLLAVVGSVLGLAPTPPAMGQALFSTGSDGSDGELSIAAGATVEIDLGLAGTGPGTGVFDAEHFAIVFQFSSITLGKDSTLTFKNHPLNPPLVILSQGDVYIEGGILVEGKPGVAGINPLGGLPGAGGWPGGSGHRPGLGGAQDGFGPGAGSSGGDVDRGEVGDRVGSAAHATFAGPAQPRDGTTYGSRLLTPLSGGGSGGGGNTERSESGGGGGGSILVASDTVIELVSRRFSARNISARGGNGGYRTGSGSGGSIRVLAPRVKGSGWLDATGGSSGGSTGGAGYARVDAIFKDELAINWGAPTVYSAGANMTVWPPYTPRLEILSIDGTAVLDGKPALLETAEGADPVAVPVEVSARGFPPATGVAFAQVKLTPENVRGLAFDLDIPLDVTAGDGTKGGSATLMIPFPPGMLSRVDAWLRAAPAGL